MTLCINYSWVYAEDQLLVTYVGVPLAGGQSPFCCENPSGIARDRQRKKSLGFIFAVKRPPAQIG